MHFGDDATAISSSHPSRLQSHLECLCPSGPTLARKLAVQGNVREGLHNVQNHERTCRRNPHPHPHPPPLSQVCSSPETAAPGGHKYQLKSFPLRNGHVPALSYFPLAVQLWNSFPTCAPPAVWPYLLWGRHRGGGRSGLITIGTSCLLNQFLTLPPAEQMFDVDLISFYE